MVGNGFGNVELPENLSEKELRWSSWWVGHRERLRQWGLRLFIVVDALLMIYAAWGFADWLLLSGVKEELAVRQITALAYAQASPAADAQEIQIGTPLVFSVPGDRYDLAVEVTNPNPNHWVGLEYSFTNGASDTTVQRGFILPGETKRLVAVGAKLTGGVTDVRIRVLARSFYRVDRHAIPDYQSWSRSRLNLVAVDQQYAPPDPNATVPTSVTSFTLVNQTAYSYYDIGLVVSAFRGDSLQGVNTVKVSSLKAGERRPVQLYWYQNLPGVTRFEVAPDLNIFDPRVYQAPGA